MLQYFTSVREKQTFEFVSGSYRNSRSFNFSLTAFKLLHFQRTKFKVQLQRVCADAAADHRSMKPLISRQEAISNYRKQLQERENTHAELKVLLVIKHVSNWLINKLISRKWTCNQLRNQPNLQMDPERPASPHRRDNQQLLLINLQIIFFFKWLIDLCTEKEFEETSSNVSLLRPDAEKLKPRRNW